MSQSTSNLRTRGDATRESLITGAIAVFGRDGFHGASTRAIAEAAGVQQALIGYHFQGKEGLYVAVFEHITRELSVRLSPLIAEIEAHLERSSPRASGEDRAKDLELMLRLTDGAVAMMSLDESAHWADLLSREQQAPTDAFRVFYEGFAGRMLGVLTKLVVRLRGDDERRARLSVISIWGQILIVRTARAGVLRLLGWDSIGEKEVALIQEDVRRNITAQMSGAPPKAPRPTRENSSGRARVGKSKHRVARP